MSLYQTLNKKAQLTALESMYGRMHTIIDKVQIAAQTLNPRESIWAQIGNGEEKEATKKGRSGWSMW